MILFHAALTCFPVSLWDPEVPRRGPFLLPLPTIVLPPPPYADLNIARVPVTSSGFYLQWVLPSAYVAPIQYLPLLPSTYRPLPLSFPRSFALLVSGSPVLLPACYCLSRPSVAPSLGVFWSLLMLGLFLFGCPFVH